MATLSCGCLDGLAAGWRRAPHTPRPEWFGSARRIVAPSAALRLAEDYDVSELLCEGGFGRVYTVLDRRCSHRRALKVVELGDPAAVAALDREVSLQSELDHSHIVRTYEAFVDERTYSICMELCVGHDLAEALDEVDHVCEDVAQHVFSQLAQAVRYMHGHGVVHRDLKAENCLLQYQHVPLERNFVKLADFGFARRFTPGEPGLTTMCGTPGYAAPEVFQGEPYDEACDVFSLGVCLFLLLTGRLPFGGATPAERIRNTRRRALSFSPDEAETLSESVQELVERMCEKWPTSRPSADDVPGSAWLSEAPTPPLSPASSERIRERLRSYDELPELIKTSLCRVAYHCDVEVTDVSMARGRFDSGMSGTTTSEESPRAEDHCLFDLDPTRLDTLYHEVDTRSHGGISYTEFVAAMLSQEDELPEGACRSAFRSLDKHDHGFISVQDLQEAVSDAHHHASGGGAPSLARRRHLRHAVAELVGPTGACRDGRVSFEEFLTLLRRGRRPSTEGGSR